jgi:hypothetical protein
MAKSQFELDLDKALGLKKTPPKAYTDMRQRLEQAAALLQERLNGGRHSVQVVLEPGHLVNVGQQFNVVVLIPQLNNFRASKNSHCRA